VLEAGEEIKDLLGAEGQGFLLGLRRSRWLGVLVSHPFSKKKRKGWGTRRVLKMRVLRLHFVSLRMTGLWRVLRRPKSLREEARGAGFGLGAEVVEFDVAQDGGLDS
jgi:hypothetical protein